MTVADRPKRKKTASTQTAKETSTSLTLKEVMQNPLLSRQLTRQLSQGKTVVAIRYHGRVYTFPVTDVVKSGYKMAKVKSR